MTRASPGLAAANASDPNGSLRARNKARTRAAILEASLACITEQGLQSTTMDQIAAAAKVARATLFNYFSSKSAIVDALVAETDTGFLRAMESWQTEPGLGTGARLLGLFAATAFYLQRGPARKRALVALSWLHWSDRRSVSRVRATRAAFGALLREGRAAGDVPDLLDVDRAADLICDAYLGLVHSWWIEGDDAIDHRFDATARLLARMIDPHQDLPSRAPTLRRQAAQ